MEDAEKLSMLSLECVMEHLDANKRILLSICFNNFRRLEKLMPIRFGKLNINSSSIVINGLDFTFEEVYGLDNDSDLSVEEPEKRMQGVRGRGWSSLFDDVPKPGDVTIGKCVSIVLEQQKEVKLQEFRHIFMSLLERFLRFVEGVNPIEAFERNITEDRSSWHAQFSKIFEEINGFPSWEIYLLYNEHPLADYDVAVEDKLTELYPNAFELMKFRIEELTALGDARSTALKRLAYAPVIVPHYNEFGISRCRRPIYQNRLPEGLSLRQAFKQFSTVILGGRKSIQGNFSLTGQGIIPLPIGLKFECEEIPFNILKTTGLFIRDYERNINELNEVTISMHLEETEGVNPLIVEKCKDNTYSKFPTKETIQVGIRNYSPEYYFTIIEEWCKQKNHKIGSRLMIITDFSVLQLRVYDQFLEMGFKRGERNETLFLQKNENAKVELTTRRNMNHELSPEFARLYNIKYFYHLEIISST